MRQFIIDKTPDAKGLVTVAGKDFRYLRQVLRVKVGDMISLRLPDGVLQNSTVASIDEKSKKILLQVCAATGEKTITRGVQATDIQDDVTGENGTGIEYWLFQFIPKPVKFEQIVRQATECGAKNIVPVIGEYSEKSSIAALQNSKKERIERIIKEARQQSGSPVNTEVYEPVSLEEAVSLWQEGNGEGVGFVLCERECECNNIGEILKNHKDKKRICIVCGSEGGISPEEVEILLKKGLFYPIHFSVNILRCETAALYGIAAVQTAV